MIIMRGMPGGVQPAIGLLPWPSAAWSATLASNTVWYSGVRGGACRSPAGLLGSNVAALVRSQRPFQSGYFASSCARAGMPAMVMLVMVSMAASAIAPSDVPQCMDVSNRSLDLFHHDLDVV